MCFGFFWPPLPAHHHNTGSIGTCPRNGITAKPTGWIQLWKEVWNECSWRMCHSLLHLCFIAHFGENFRQTAGGRISTGIGCWICVQNRCLVSGGFWGQMHQSSKTYDRAKQCPSLIMESVPHTSKFFYCRLIQSIAQTTSLVPHLCMDIMDILKLPWVLRFHETDLSLGLSKHLYQPGYGPLSDLVSGECVLRASADLSSCSKRDGYLRFVVGLSSKVLKSVSICIWYMILYQDQ